MIRFPYLDEPLVGPPPSLPVGANVRRRPLVPVTLIGPSGKRRLFPRALLDPGADDTVVPMGLVRPLDVKLRPDSGHGLRWRGQGYSLRFGDLALEFTDGVQVWRWSGIVGFPRLLFGTLSSVCAGACSSSMPDSLEKAKSWNWKPILPILER
jgi:hypothetical protein